MADNTEKAAEAEKDSNPQTQGGEQQEPDQSVHTKFPLEVIPEILWLLTQSPTHKYMFLADMEWYLLPPITLNQFRIFRHEGRALAYVAWAMVNDEVDARLRKGIVRLKPIEWRSGKLVWITDLVAPAGGTEPMLKSLKEQVFKDVTVNLIAPDENGNISVREL